MNVKAAAKILIQQDDDQGRPVDAILLFRDQKEASECFGAIERGGVFTYLEISGFVEHQKEVLESCGVHRDFTILPGHTQAKGEMVDVERYEADSAGAAGRAVDKPSSEDAEWLRSAPIAKRS